MLGCSYKPHSKFVCLGFGLQKTLTLLTFDPDTIKNDDLLVAKMGFARGDHPCMG